VEEKREEAALASEEIYDNRFVNDLEKSGFLKEIWGGENYRR
jgi:hypothetical protein